jgi:hypothetical protein
MSATVFLHNGSTDPNGDTLRATKPHLQNVNLDDIIEIFLPMNHSYLLGGCIYIDAIKVALN